VTLYGIKMYYASTGGTDMPSLLRRHPLFFLLASMYPFLLGGWALPPRALAQIRGNGIEDIKIYVRAADGSQLSEIAEVSLIDQFNQVVQQGTTRGGFVEFYGVKGGNYTLQVVAANYEKHLEPLDVGESGGGVFAIALRPAGNNHQIRAAAGPPLLSPVAQKELAKSSEALRTNNLKEAHIHLDTAYRLVPNNPEVNYLFGLYYAKTGDWQQAKTHWEKTLSLAPEHLRAILALSEALIREKNYPEAVQLLHQTAEANPEAWRPHALLAEAYLQQGSLEESIQQAERALELGHAQAAPVQTVLVRALLQKGDKQRAIDILRAQVQAHPEDLACQKQLQDLQNPPTPRSTENATIAPLELPRASLTPLADSPPVPSNWLPPDIDEQVPPVLPGHVCNLDQVLPKAAARVKELVSNVDKYTATESLFHESVNKWGLVSFSDNLSFNYLVSIQEIKPGALSVEEHRESRRAPVAFPDHIVTNGLPSLPLIFHPYYSGNYAMTCEGKASWNGGMTYQIYFRQRPDKPNTMRYYRLGVGGQAVPAALKGRAWVSADSFQIVRMEAALLEPIPTIQLLADFTIIEYGPVHFKKIDQDMWLPKSVEYYYDWRGKRAHRHHKFDNYLLFSVDDKQRIAAPKNTDPSGDPAGEHSSPSRND
jgi:tetratricopeptide (TPR) repeat protein